MVSEANEGGRLSFDCDDRSGRGDADGRVVALWRKRSGILAGGAWNLCGSVGRVRSILEADGAVLLQKISDSSDCIRIAGWESDRQTSGWGSI